MDDLMPDLIPEIQHFIAGYQITSALEDDLPDMIEENPKRDFMGLQGNNMKVYGDFVCDDCLQVVESQDELDAHMTEFHS
uniref:C2H2-type domain-containing protein n=1 Tax=Caenorhabditis tropicalis TaxID=1561998 RepID=A0A1I7U1S8_9PELO